MNFVALKFVKVRLSLAQFPMKNAWKIPGKASALNPPSFTSSEPIPPPPIPPDPPDPASPLSPIQFPPLSSAFSTGSKSFSSQKRETRTLTPPLTAAASTQQLLPSTGASAVAPASTKKPIIESREKYFPRSENITVQSTVFGSQQENHNLKNSKPAPTPQKYAPILSNKFSSLPTDLPTATPNSPLADAMEVDKQLTPFLKNYASTSPDPTPRPSLKRCRSSPTLSPPNTSNQNPNPFFSRPPSPFVLPSSGLASLTVFQLPPATEKNSPPLVSQFSATETNSFPLSDQSSSMPPPCINTDPPTSLAIQEAISHGGDLPRYIFIKTSI
ncbi:hypothetical protein HID58_036494 [Brassica napus]|uniref:Uncharacterized protein n=1 Tax=Brassica napus TaxID=3708 RepID=A0ABQ8C841_BRANA|nr:hypothetical protein HID58_036494 [Brassica napus]